MVGNGSSRGGSFSDGSFRDGRSGTIRSGMVPSGTVRHDTARETLIANIFVLPVQKSDADMAAITAVSTPLRPTKLN